MVTRFAALSPCAGRLDRQLGISAGPIFSGTGKSPRRDPVLTTTKMSGINQ